MADLTAVLAESFRTGRHQAGGDATRLRTRPRMLGGPGSGNFGHGGRPGEVGGSAGNEPDPSTVAKALEEARIQLSAANGVGIAQMSYALKYVPISSVKLRERKKAVPALVAAYKRSPRSVVPVSVERRFEGDDKKPVVLDGHRRIASAKAAGLTSIWVVEVHDVTSLRDDESRYSFDPGSSRHYVFPIRTAGGPGSGNFGHAGRPGEVGGSGPLGVTFENMHVDSYGSAGNMEHKYVVRAEDNQGRVGYAQYTVYKDAVHIDMIKVDDRAQRKGVGMQLLREVAKANPGMKINPGYQTTEGSKLWRSFQKERRRAALTEKKRTLPIPEPGEYDRLGRYVAPIQELPLARPSGPWDTNRAAGGPGSGNFSHTGRPGEVGGSTTSGSNEQPTMSHVARMTVETVEAPIRNLHYENGYIVSKDGTVLAELTDESVDSIRIPIEGHDWSNTIFTHNHPWGVGLSIDDTAVAMRTNMREMRAVTGAGLVYSIRRTGDAWPETLVDELVGENELVRVNFTEKIKAGQLTIAEANLAHYHELYSRVAARHSDLRYTRTQTYAKAA